MVTEHDVRWRVGMTHWITHLKTRKVLWTVQKTSVPNQQVIWFVFWRSSLWKGPRSILFASLSSSSNLWVLSSSRHSRCIVRYAEWLKKGKGLQLSNSSWIQRAKFCIWCQMICDRGILDEHWPWAYIESPQEHSSVFFYPKSHRARKILQGSTHWESWKGAQKARRSRQNIRLMMRRGNWGWRERWMGRENRLIGKKHT